MRGPFTSLFPFFPPPRKNLPSFFSTTTSTFDGIQFKTTTLLFFGLFNRLSLSPVPANASDNSPTHFRWNNPSPNVSGPFLLPFPSFYDGVRTPAIYSVLRSNARSTPLSLSIIKKKRLPPPLSKLSDKTVLTGPRRSYGSTPPPSLPFFHVWRHQPPFPLSRRSQV